MRYVLYYIMMFQFFDVFLSVFSWLVLSVPHWHWQYRYCRGVAPGGLLRYFGVLRLKASIITSTLSHCCD